jgi:hypothetical protein
MNSVPNPQFHLLAAGLAIKIWPEFAAESDRKAAKDAQP